MAVVKTVKRTRVLVITTPITQLEPCKPIEIRLPANARRVTAIMVSNSQ